MTLSYIFSSYVIIHYYYCWYSCEIRCHESRIESLFSVVQSLFCLLFLCAAQNIRLRRDASSYQAPNFFFRRKPAKHTNLWHSLLISHIRQYYYMRFTISFCVLLMFLISNNDYYCSALYYYCHYQWSLGWVRVRHTVSTDRIGSSTHGFFHIIYTSIWYKATVARSICNKLHGGETLANIQYQNKKFINKISL